MTEEQKTKADKIIEEMEQLRQDYKSGSSDLKTALTTLTQKSDEFNALIKEMKQSQTHTESSGHKNLDELADCPNCKPKLLEKFKPDILKAERDKRLKMKQPKLCEDCGEIVDYDKEKNCPTCKGSRL